MRKCGGIGSHPRVVVIILNHNGLRWLPRCLSGLVKTSYPNYEIILVDNGSSDSSIEFVRREYASVKVVANSVNLGFAEAYNRVINQVEAEYVVLLNNDTEILNPNWVTRLVEASEDAGIGAVACRIVCMGDHGILDSVGGAGIPYWRDGFFDVGRGELDVGQYGNGFEPFAYCGGAALIRKSAFVDSGMLDSKFFAHFDDPDLSWRLRLRGWRVSYAPDAKVAHYRGGTLGGGEVTPLILYYCNRNFLRAIIKNCSVSLPWALRNYALYTSLITLAFLVFEPMKSVMLVKGLVWNFRNLRDSWMARLIIQSRRKVDEREILRLMFPALTRTRSVEHSRLTRIMDVLFELSQRAKFQAMTS